jgi:hypothetical protein
MQRRKALRLRQADPGQVRAIDHKLKILCALSGHKAGCFELW